MFYFSSVIIVKQLRLLFAFLWMCLKFQTPGYSLRTPKHSLLTKQPVGQWGSSRAVLLFGPQRSRAETDEKVEGSYSLLTWSKWLTWRIHDAGISYTFAHGYTNTCALLHKCICSLSVTHNRACICACVHTRAKQSWLSLIDRLWKQICLNVFTVSRGEENKERDVALDGREICLLQRVSGEKLAQYRCRCCTSFACLLH